MEACLQLTPLHGPHVVISFEHVVHSPAQMLCGITADVCIACMVHACELTPREGEGLSQRPGLLAVHQGAVDNTCGSQLRQ